MGLISHIGASHTWSTGKTQEMAATQCYSLVGNCFS